MKLSLDEVKTIAVNFTETSIRQNCLFKYMPGEDTHDWSIGDPETLESLASMVVNTEGVKDMDSYEAELAVLSHLEETFPDY